MNNNPSSYALQKAAQAWCKSRNRNTVMDVDLATSFAEIIDEVLRKKLKVVDYNGNPFYSKNQ